MNPFGGEGNGVLNDTERIQNKKNQREIVELKNTIVKINLVYKLNNSGKKREK